MKRSARLLSLALALLTCLSVLPGPVGAADEPAETDAVLSEDVSTVEEVPLAEENILILDGDEEDYSDGFNYSMDSPEISSIKNTTKGIKLVWGAVDGAVAYRVYRCIRDDESENWTMLKETKKLAFTDTSGEVGTWYRYYVEGVDSKGHRSFGHWVYTYQYLHFDAPKLETISIDNSDYQIGIQIAWEDVGDDVKYQILRKTGNGKWKKLDVTYGTVYTDYSAKTSKTYTYTVRCVHTADNNPISPYDPIGLTQKMSTYKYSAPDFTISSNLGDTRITWYRSNENTNLVRILRKTPGGKWKKLADVEPDLWSSRGSYYDTTAENGKTYYYAIRYVSEKGKSLSEIKAQKFKLNNTKVTGSYNQTEARSMLKLINAWRTSSDAWYWNSNNTTKTKYNVSGSQKLGKLTYDYNLEKIAMQRAAELAALFSHTRPNGTSYSTLYYKGTCAIGENIWTSYNRYNVPASDVFENWQETDEDYDGQGHRRNMLKYNTVGIASFQVDEYTFWVMELGYTNSGAKKTKAVNSTKTVTIER